MAPDRPWARGVFWGIVAFALCVLLVDLRRPRDVLLALVASVALVPALDVLLPGRGRVVQTGEGSG